MSICFEYRFLKDMHVDGRTILYAFAPNGPQLLPKISNKVRNFVSIKIFSALLSFTFGSICIIMTVVLSSLPLFCSLFLKSLKSFNTWHA